jgi:proline dehydrogenase
MPVIKRGPITNLHSAIKRVRYYNKKGISVSISYLPIRYRDQTHVTQVVKEYDKIFRAIKRERLNADVTIKLHQLGIYKNFDLAKKNTERLVKLAKKRGVFVWIDQEKAETVEDAIRIFWYLKRKYGNVGVCQQAYLKPTLARVKTLIDKGATVRPVKGFYNDCQFDSWEQVTQNYGKMMKYILLHGKHPIVATHDLGLLARARRLIKKKHIKNVEFQFFWGARDKLAEQLVEEGYPVRIYLPFGNIWKFLYYGFWTFDLKRAIQRVLGFPRVF